MRSSATKLYEIGELEYEVSIDSFHPGERGDYWSPGSGPEVSPATTVEVYRDGKPAGSVAFDAFVALLGADLGPGVDAQEKIEEDLIEVALDALYHD